MLVLSRKKNESIVINGDITVTVVEIRGDKVRLGIVHPKDVSVHRQEVFDAIHGQSAKLSPSSSPQPAPPPQPGNEESMSIQLDPWHMRFLDRLVMQLKMAHTGRSIRREEILEALLEGIEASTIDFSKATSLERPKSLFAEK